jgi:preprotein translocase SecE subunit
VANKMSEKKKSASQGEMEESKAQASEKELKSARASAREERQSKPANKPAKRDARASQASSKKSGGFRNWGPVRFSRDSYRELRYKVTWPTFVEARNMTIIVIVLSTIVGLILGLLDQGLLQAFKLITGK